MKIFNCDHCGQAVFFENVQCLQCGSTLAFLPDRLFIAAVEPRPPQDDAQSLGAPGAAEPEAAGAPPADAVWRRRGRPRSPRSYRMCANRVQYQTCNFAVAAGDPSPLCVSCRQTRLLPDLSVPGHLERWYRIEAAKRRLYYTLARLGLVNPRRPQEGTPPPVFEFLADLPGAAPVMTGHVNGLITLNVAEADDDERARRRLALHEPYRTLLGHLRHESGHYYWDVLVQGAGRTEAFREVFGDESQDYGQALAAYYANGQPSADTWQAAHVSAYATAHPWEDWAETWAHYLHMVDLLETAAAYGAKVEVPGLSEQAEEIESPFATAEPDFDELVRQWVPLTLLLNSLNRSLGQNDAYPFALSPGALRKLRCVHELIRATNDRTDISPMPASP